MTKRNSLGKPSVIAHRWSQHVTIYKSRGVCKLKISILECIIYYKNGFCNAHYQFNLKYAYLKIIIYGV